MGQVRHGSATTTHAVRAAICFVVPCGYTSELFDLCEVILHQMAPLVDLHIIIALDFTVGFGRDHSSCTALIKVL